MAGKFTKRENQHSRDTNNIREPGTLHGDTRNSRESEIGWTPTPEWNQQLQGYQLQQETNKSREANNSRKLNTSTARCQKQYGTTNSWDANNNREPATRIN